MIRGKYDKNTQSNQDCDEASQVENEMKQPDNRIFQLVKLECGVNLTNIENNRKKLWMVSVSSPSLMPTSRKNNIGRRKEMNNSFIWPFYKYFQHHLDVDQLLAKVTQFTNHPLFNSMKLTSYVPDVTNHPLFNSMKLTSYVPDVTNQTLFNIT
jgi:hypothetical protein